MILSACDLIQSAYHFLGYARPNHHFITGKRKHYVQCQLLSTAEVSIKKSYDNTRPNTAAKMCRSSKSWTENISLIPLIAEALPFIVLPVWVFESVHERQKVCKWLVESSVQSFLHYEYKEPCAQIAKICNNLRRLLKKII